MKTVSVQAWAKINLALDVLERREDGYHNLRMVMHSAGLCDRLTLTPRAAGETEHRLEVRSPRRKLAAALPTDRRNLALAAAEMFLQRTGRTDIRLDILLEKHIPVCAGLGGGSSDAAAVLRGLRDALSPSLPDSTLLAWALALGSDVPYCLLGGTRLAEGRGEVMTLLPPLPPCTMVVCKPEAAVSTPKAFALLDREKVRRRPDFPGLLRALARGSLAEVGRYMYNVFEDVLVRENRRIGEIRDTLMDCGAAGAVMSGTGSAVFGLFDDRKCAGDAWDVLRQDYECTYLCGGTEEE